jgi:hypothetical protein
VSRRATQKSGAYRQDEHGVVASVGGREFGFIRAGKLWHAMEWPEGHAADNSASRGADSKEHATQIALKLAERYRNPALPGLDD